MGSFIFGLSDENKIQRKFPAIRYIIMYRLCYNVSWFACRKSSDMLSKEFDRNPDEFAKSFSIDSSLDNPPSLDTPEDNDQILVPNTPLEPIGEVDEDFIISEPISPHQKVN